MKIRNRLALSALFFCLAWLGWSSSKIASVIISSSRASAAAAVAPAPMGARVCGLVSAYSPATGGAAGSIKIGGVSFAIAPGTGLTGLAVGQDVCMPFCFDGAGLISGQNGPATAGQGLAQICGIVTNFSASAGGVNGSVTIGGAKIRLPQGTYFAGQNQVAPGSNSCLFPIGVGDQVGASSFFIQNSSPKQIRIPSLVRGQTFDSQEDNFYLPEPTILTLDADNATVFPVNGSTFGKVLSSERPKVEGFSYSTPYSTVQALSCNESFWDMEFEIAGKGATEGDMVTVNLLNSNKTIAQQLAMLTIENGGASLKSLHPEVKLLANGIATKGLNYFAPFLIGAGESGLRTIPLALALSTSSSAFNGCYQLAIEIKRAGGAGTTTVVVENVIVKRMERPGDRDINIGFGQITGGVGWYPSGKICEFICWPCNVQPPPCGSISGLVFCDSNGNGVKDSGEAAIAGVEIKLVGAGGTRTTNTLADGSYRFDGVCAGTYTLIETQPTGSPVSGDGKAYAGTCGGDAGVNTISSIPVPNNANCVNYNFAEKCDAPMPVKCDTICWRQTQFFITNIQHLPGGTVLIYGVNSNNPVGTVTSTNAIRQALYGGTSVTARFNKEYITGQLSQLYAGGGGSPVVFNTLWSALSCSGISFGPVTLSNGVTLSSASLLDTLVTQSNLAIRQNRTQDMAALADIWALLNGRCAF